MFKFNLKLHLNKVQKEEKANGSSLKKYTQFIQLISNVYKFLPKLVKGVGK
jgi:hypothetical protein